MPIPDNLFLSHSSHDQSFVESFAEVLRRHQIPFWYSSTNIVGAQQWHDEIGKALRQCDWFLIVLSPHSVASMWVKRELLYALQQNRYENRIIPLLYQEGRSTEGGETGSNKAKRVRVKGAF